MLKTPKSHPTTASPGVKGLAGEQGAVVVVADEVRRRRRAVAARRFEHNADLQLVLGVPNVEQEDVEDQDGVGRDHAACRTIKTDKEGGKKWSKAGQEWHLRGDVR